ncbi:hypothetical protein [Streptomyces beigongshangae]|uniref:hypothetical protein n=1 Tax=Streptomyces beigongshangae TaxID=2841597 RepID=UPI001C841460|nr:hypothetical protein [Streptomyces sp. REN17]
MRKHRHATRNLIRGVLALGLSAVAATSTGGSASAADYGGSRSFDISVPGARYKGVVNWKATDLEPPSTFAEIVDAQVSDTAPDDYRAVAYVHYEVVAYEYVCNADDWCAWRDGERTVHAKRFLGTATPNGDTGPANWSYDAFQGRVENVWVGVCTEQWRTDPDTTIRCSGWK